MQITGRCAILIANNRGFYMPKNKFDIVISVLTPNGLVDGKTVIPNVSIGKLSLIGRAVAFAGKIFFRRKIYVKAHGDMDLSGVITKTNRNFNVSCFSKLLVVGDFRCSKYSKVFPVAVYGWFDCSGMSKGWIDKDFRFPITRKIDCSHSINNLDDLIGLLPDELRILVVEQKFVKQEFLEKNMDIVEKFLKMYPNVKVVDIRGRDIRDAINKIVTEKKNKEKELVDSMQKNKDIAKDVYKLHDMWTALAEAYPNLEKEITYYMDKKIYASIAALPKDKPDEILKFMKKAESLLQNPEKFFQELEKAVKIEGKHLDVQDLFARFRPDAEFNGLSDDDLIRFVRYVLSNQRNNGIKKITLHRLADDTDVICVFAYQLPQIYDDLKQLVLKNKEKHQEPAKEKTPVVKPVVAPEKNETKINTVVIKKYIKLSQYKDLEKSSGRKNVLDALRIINEINQNPLDMQFQGPVHVVKESKSTVSKTAKKEFGCAVVQSIDSSTHDDNKRLVWKVADGPDGLVLICVGFVKDHNKSKWRWRKKYNDLLQEASKKESYTLEDLSDYINVGELLKFETGKSDSDIDFADVISSKNLPMDDFQR